MKKLFLLGLTALLALGACKKKDHLLTIGEFTSLSGSTASFGQSMNEGIQLALTEVNQAGGLLGKQVEILVEDNQSRPEESRTAAVKLIKHDHVVALIGEVASSLSLAAAPEAQRNKIPMISPASTNPKVTETGDYVFRACFTDSFQGAAMARFAFEDLGLRKIAILYDVKNDYSVGLTEYFGKTFRELGGEIVDQQGYSEGDIEFRAQLTKIKNKAPQALYLPGYYVEVGLVARQARDLGLQIPILGGDGWDSPKTIEIGGAAIDGSYFSNHYATDDPSPIVQGFIAKYRAQYGKVPDAFAILGYDAANILFDAIKRANSADGPKIRDALAATSGYQGVTGSITMDANRNANKRIVILKIEGGKVKFHKAMEPS